jgi:ADP-ribose pyrophosphatase YjhB (NUDIX family)
MRHSKVVYVLIRLSTADGPSLLLRRHEKWGDWSLVGGHVEDWELDDWGLAAAREASEELEPLVTGQDFVVTPIHPEPITWGPEASRSARGERTIYHIQYFTLAFLRDPVALLGRLPIAEFLLVPERELGSAGHALGSPVHRARRFLQGGLEAVPRSWAAELDPHALPAGLQPVTPAPAPMK